MPLKGLGRQGGVKRRQPPGKAGKGGPVPKKRGFGPRFVNQRVADIEESDTDASEDVPPSDEESESNISDSEEEQPASNAYAALMQSFAKESAPQAKRRKLGHTAEDGQTTNLHEPESEPEEDRDVDLVEEPEEGPEDEVEIDSDDDDVPDTSDPFETHFSMPDQTELTNRLKAIKANDYSSHQYELNKWRLVRSLPGKEAAQSTRAFPKMSGPADLKLKQKLAETAMEKLPAFNPLEQVLYPATFGYSDLLFCGRTTKNADSLRQMVVLHAVNHIFKTRDRVIKNNAKLAKESDNTEFEPRDQGFTRPKVLMLLPTRQSAVNMVNTICSIYPPDQQENRKRFDDSYLDKDAKFSADRPEDFRELFEGNDDDMFRLGVKFTRKTIKYFSQFYNSDILIASPLGLRMAIGSEEDKKKLDYDFLSSIEMVIVDQADALLMQNWEHFEFIFEHLNLQPREAHGCEFTRVREWYLEKQAENFRQTMIFSAFNTPELSELHRQCQNWAGRVRVQPEYPGTIQEIGVKAKQTFSRLEATSIAAEPDARFAYFTGAIVPALVKRARDMSGTLIFVPSYLDYVRVRNYFATSPAVANLTFGTISEYADVPEASRARSHFLNGRHKVLLYTERAHHFRRYMLNGVQRVIMYGLPDNPIFYKEIAGGYLAKSERDSRIEPGTGAVRVLFSKYDLLKLERIVGSKRVGKMIRERGDTFDFI
ncbi:putative nucleolus protein required for cell viability [Pseudomassariella vexata]|uniref:U3 small nucleolar RNA-associated protein 25 n=1 Tax=Pseudomassariella vexata TaxID=1141098 RepID=A0A1Y2DK21_9PEZI|nr:putative nucleolus protein required for cell viability [Pseudomassariella vexata]ORY59571.1 putative nucleolus protein required for cell viability [Pseudomassariella vexata]